MFNYGMYQARSLSVNPYGATYRAASGYGVSYPGGSYGMSGGISMDYGMHNPFGFGRLTGGYNPYRGNQFNTNPFGSSLNNNIYSTNLNANGLNISHQNAPNGVNFTGISNAHTGTQIGQVSTPFGSITNVTGQNIQNVSQTTAAINTPGFSGNQTTTTVADDKYVYNIKRTTGWVA